MSIVVAVAVVGIFLNPIRKYIINPNNSDNNLTLTEINAMYFMAVSKFTSYWDYNCTFFVFSYFYGRQHSPSKEKKRPSTQPVYCFCKALVIKQAKTVNNIFGFTSTISSGRAQVRAPIFLLIEIAYCAFDSLS